MTANASREPSTAVLGDIAPDSGRKLTSTEKWRFGVGFVLFSLIWMVAGTSGSAVLLPQRFTELNIGVPEVILGTMNSVGCVFALFSNVIFGALSDITRSRFGKRTPWIVAGGLITAAGYVLAFSSAQLVGIVAGWCIVQVGVNMMIAPAVAVLSDRKVIANAPLPEVERLDHPWIREYFHGPRARAARGCRESAELASPHSQLPIPDSH